MPYGLFDYIPESDIHTMGSQLPMCPMDVKKCPDGKTFVSRVPPKCDFAPCPSDINYPQKTIICPDGWDSRVPVGAKTIRDPCLGHYCPQVKAPKCVAPKKLRITGYSNNACRTPSYLCQ